MTHTQWEHGEQLKINNATKDQLKFMVVDRDRQVKQLQVELEETKKALNEVIGMLKNMV